MHLVKNLACVFDVTVIGKRRESENFGGSQRVVDLGGFDQMGMDLLQVFDGFAECDLWEE